MTRISILAREDMNEEQGALFDTARAAGAPTGGPHWAYIRVPALMRQCQGLGGFLRDSPLGPRERQIAVLTAVRHFGAAFPWAVQVRGSLRAGLDEAVIEAINTGKDPGLTDPREQAAYRVARELLSDHALGDETYAAALAAFGEADLVTLVATVGYFCMVSCTANAFDITPPDDAPARLAP